MTTLSRHPLISIITPSLNQAQFLREALESVQSQTYAPIEHIVLDGGSKDSSRELLERFSSGQENRSLWWRSSKDEGQSAALNEGFARSTGEIIGWLNADDRYRPHCLEAVERAFAEHPEVDIFYGDYTFMDESGKHLALRREIEFSRFILRYHHVLYVATTATFFRRRIFDEGNFLETSLHYAMDLEFFLRLADAGYRFQHLPNVLADFRVHPASKSSAFRERQRAEHRRIVMDTTPLSHRIKSPSLRNIAASALQVPAAMMRYSEKLRRGLYFSTPDLPGINSMTAPTKVGL
jgi:glycosyltransferase involved in cell wall biosynthesis